MELRKSHISRLGIPAGVLPTLRFESDETQKAVGYESPPTRDPTKTPLVLLDPENNLIC